MTISVSFTRFRKWLLVISAILLSFGQARSAQVELLSNNGFESGASSFWYRNGDSGIFQGSYPHPPGAWYGYLGNVNNAIGSIHQFINIPANASSATLIFHLNIVSFETGTGTTFDKMDVNFRHATTDALLKKWKTYSESDKGGNVAGQYSQQTISFDSSELSQYKGQTVLLQFYAATDYADSTIFRIDDVSFLVTTDDTPAAPSFFETVGYAEHIDLGWADNSSNETGFEVERKVNNGNFSQLTTVGANTTAYTDNGVFGCDVYTYRVRAYNDAGNSPYTDESVNFLRPAAPNNLIATPTADVINLVWQDNACNEDGFKLERRTGADGAWTLFRNFAPNTVGVTDNSASLDITYFYRVSAYNASGNSTYSGEASASRSQTCTVHASSGLNGTLTPNGTVTVSAGQDLDLSANPASNYIVDKWFLDEAIAQNGGNSYKLSGVTANHTVLVTFTPRLYRLEIGGGVDDVQVFLDGIQVNTASIYNLVFGTQVTVRKNPQSPFQFVDYWSLVNQSASQTVSGMSLSTPMFSDTVLQAIVGIRNSNPVTGGTISGGTPILTVPPSETTSTEVTRHVQRSDDLVCWRDYDLDPSDAQVAVTGAPCSFGEPGKDTAFFRTLFDVRVHAEPVLLFPIPERSATTVRVTSLLDHCNQDPLTTFPADSSPNSDWYANGVIGGHYHKDKMFMTYKGEVLCEQNSVVEKVPDVDPAFNLLQFTKTTPLLRPLEFNWNFNGNTVIGYSGHPGYDFGVSEIGDNVIVVACEAGTVIPNLSGSYENRIFVEHEHLGLATAYLHMKKWSKEIFDHNDTAVDSRRFYYAKPVRVGKGENLGLVGGAGFKDGKMSLTAFQTHLHVELYRVVFSEGRKYYVLMDPYGAYTQTGKQAYGSSWLPSVTGSKTYQADYYRP